MKAVLQKVEKFEQPQGQVGQLRIVGCIEDAANGLEGRFIVALRSVAVKAGKRVPVLFAQKVDPPVAAEEKPATVESGGPNRRS